MKLAIDTTFNNGQRHSLLLRCLSKRTRYPSQDDRVNGVYAGCEEEAGDVARCDVEGCSADEETDDSDTHHDSYVPGAVVVLAGGYTDQDADSTCDEGGWCCEDKGDGSVEAE
jgi:hypothetical protein